MKKLILSIAVFSLCCSACVEDDIMIVNAPCEWNAAFSAVPDTCFDLPRNPNGSVLNVQNELGYSFELPIFDPKVEGRIYYTRAYQPNVAEVQLIRGNLCENSTVIHEITVSENIIGLSINDDGNLIYQTDFRTVVYYDASNESFNTIYNDIFTNAIFWINNSTFAASSYIEEFGEVRFVSYDTSGALLDTLPLSLGSVSSRNTTYIAWYDSPGPIQIYDAETLELIKSIPRPAGFQGAISSSWIDDDNLALVIEVDKLAILNISTEEETLLLDYTDCENIGLYSAHADPFNSDRLLLHRFDHYQDADGQFFRQERISYYNIATGEEQILELQ